MKSFLLLQVGRQAAADGALSNGTCENTILGLPQLLTRLADCFTLAEKSSDISRLTFLQLQRHPKLCTTTKNADWHGAAPACSSSKLLQKIQGRTKG